MSKSSHNSSDRSQAEMRYSTRVQQELYNASFQLYAKEFNRNVISIKNLCRRQK